MVAKVPVAGAGKSEVHDLREVAAERPSRGAAWRPDASSTRYVRRRFAEKLVLDSQPSVTVSSPALEDPGLAGCRAPFELSCCLAVRCRWIWGLNNA